jgi:predicted 3-demethylubiquinone-9 3-methyltransferase (glyoxalase superfamily)/uncharacterized protein YndB with AHSA1/START domain
MMASGKLQVTTPSDREITMTRVFDAPAALVFDCWTKPELITRWLTGPDGWSFAVCEVDLRVGGAYRFVWKNQEGIEMGMGGVYREIVAPERIVNSQLFDQDWTGGETVGTLLLIDKNGKTTTTNTVRYPSKEARDGALKSGMEQGVAAGYDRLEGLFETGAIGADSATKKTIEQRITPFLWFDGKAEEAMNFYVSIFKNSKVISVSRNGDAGPGPKGMVMMATFQLDGQQFYALNGGPQYTFTPAISFLVSCETQAEVDDLWTKLSSGGTPNRCGWVSDKFGLTWQIVPSILGKLMQGPDPARSKRVMHAMLQMSKLDIEGLKKAAEEG